MTQTGFWQPRSTGADAQMPPAIAAKRQASIQASSEVDQTLVAELRGLLPREYQHVDDATVRRFIAATNGNLQLSAKRLHNTLQWRHSHTPENIVCKACAKDPKSHYMHVVGYDSLQRPIIYSCLAAATNKVFQDNHDHMIQTFETAIKLMPPGVEQWVWVCDFHGFGMSDVNPKLSKAFLSVSAEHYPERLGMFLLVDAPSLFSVLWQAISSFVDRKTYKKIRFLPWDVNSSKSTLKSFLQEHCDQTTSDWLINEMTENRVKDKVKLKAYSMSHIHSAVSSGTLTPLPPGKHDLRGCPALLEHYNSAPSVLEPQGLARHH